MVIIVGFYIFVLFVNVCKHERPVPAFCNLLAVLLPSASAGENRFFTGSAGQDN